MVRKFPPIAILIPGTWEERGPSSFIFCPEEEAIPKGLYSLECVSHPQTLGSAVHVPANQNNLHWAGRGVARGQPLFGQERASVGGTMLPPSGCR